jgi:hypothetical protein
MRDEQVGSVGRGGGIQLEASSLTPDPTPNSTCVSCVWRALDPNKPVPPASEVTLEWEGNRGWVWPGSLESCAQNGGTGRLVVENGSNVLIEAPVEGEFCGC